MLLLLAALPAYAEGPEIVVVGVHVPEQADGAGVAERLAQAVDDTRKADGLAPAEVSKRIAGREALILDTYALGPGRERLKEGKVLYDRAQPDQAIPVLSDAVKLLANGLAVSTDARDLHEALMTLGLAQVGLGEEDPARQTFRRSAVLDPARQLDAVRYPPDVISMFNAVRQEAQAAPAAGVSITASVPAKVWVDGRPVGDAPQKNLELSPGEHYILVRAPSGASLFRDLTLASGQQESISATLDQRSIGVVAEDAPGRTRQTRDLYRGLGAYTDNALVLLAGSLPDGKVGVQLYAPSSGNFSRPLTADAGGDPTGSLLDLVPTMVGYIGDNGDIRADRVSSQVLALDVGANDVLSGMLFEPPEPQATVSDDRRGVPWYVWAGVGAVVAGGGATATALLLSDNGGTEPSVNENGTIEFGPIP